MTTIRATCPTCGEVGLTPEEVDLRVDAAGEDSFYAFDCPACYETVRKPADQRVIALLLSGGVEQRDLVPEPAAPEPRFPWPPLTYDDILDLHALLETDGWFALLERWVDA